MDKKEILGQIQNQISVFDNKASILLSVVGIVFALSLSFLDVFHADFFISQSVVYRNWYYVLFSIFILSAIVSIGSLVFVIFPRKNNTGKKYPNYYYDISSMSKDELRARLSSQIDDVKDEYLLGQIMINSKICKRKNIAILIGIYSLIPFILLIAALTIMTMLG